MLDVALDKFAVAAAARKWRYLFLVECANIPNLTLPSAQKPSLFEPYPPCEDAREDKPVVGIATDPRSQGSRLHDTPHGDQHSVPDATVAYVSRTEMSG